MAVKIFQLTEWVYKFLALRRVLEPPTPSVSGVAAIEVYKDCLDWYGSVFDLLRAHENSPLVVFIQ